MKPRQWLMVAVACVAAAFAGTSTRADEPVKPSAGPYVVIVGVGEFKDKAISPRPTADADAKAFYDLVTDPKYLGVPAARTTLLLSAADPKRNGEVATHEAVLRAVNLATSES